MTKEDWFRKSTWTQQDREDFFARLRRAREHKRPEYLQIQAAHLEETGEPGMAQGALELLDLVVDRWPSSVLLESVHYQRARCLEALGYLDEAIDAYRQAFDIRRDRPNVRTEAPLSFGMFVMRHDRTDLYAEALSVLREQVTENDIIFPVQKYKYYTAFALIADFFGHDEEARECAMRARRAADMTHSGFNRHSQVGLVKKQDRKIMKQLERLSNT